MDLQVYKEKHPDKLERLTQIESQSKWAEIMLDLKGHEGVKKLMVELEQIINSINTKLLTFDRLEVEERERLLADKERCLWLLNKFPDAQLTLDRITKYLEKL